MANYTGYAFIDINGSPVGSTLKELPVTISIKPIKKQMKTEYSDAVYEEKKTNEEIIAIFTMPYTPENISSYPSADVFEGILVFTNSTGNLSVTIPVASMTVTHDLNFKSDAYHSITIEAIALETYLPDGSVREKIIISDLSS